MTAPSPAPSPPPVPRAAGDSALLVEFAEGASRAANNAAIAFERRLRATALPGVSGTAPTIRSVLVRFDPLDCQQQRLKAEMGALLAAPLLAGRRLWWIPALYDGEAGPDLAGTALPHRTGRRDRLRAGQRARTGPARPSVGRGKRDRCAGVDRMIRKLEVLSAGPGTTVQDRGRPGFLSHGLSEGDAMGDIALAEGSALVGNARDAAAIELFGFGERFRLQGGPALIALTGARFRAKIGDTPLPWRASHQRIPGEMPDIGACESQGSYGYLHIDGGIAVPLVLGSRSTNPRAGIGGLSGRTLDAGDLLPLGPARRVEAGRILPDPDHLVRRVIRICPGAQAHLYANEERARFFATCFRISERRDRMGICLGFERTAFHFIPVSQDEAVEAVGSHVAAIRALPGLTTPLIRNPATIPDLPACRLVSCAVATGDWLPWKQQAPPPASR